MRLSPIIALLSLCAVAPAQSSLVGTYKPGLAKIPAKISKIDQKKYSIVKKLASRGGMKLNPDGTFGVTLKDTMFGKWYVNGEIMTIHVTSVAGLTQKQFDNLPADQKTAKFRVERGGAFLSTLPIEPGKPVLVWRKKR